MRPTFSTPEEAISLLETIADTFHVVSGGDSIEGTWIPLPAAREIAGQFAPALGHLLPFLEDELGQAFPSPIPELKATLMSLLASASDVGEGQARMWGHPLFAGTVGAEEAVSGGAKAAATATAAVGKGARVGRGGRSCSSAEEGGGDAEEVLLGRVGRD